MWVFSNILCEVGTKNKYLDLAIFEIADCLLAPLTSVATTPVQGMAFRKIELQCSPLQAVTGKIYRLKQHFLPPATAWSVTKIKYTVSCFKKYASCGSSRSTQEKEVYTEKKKSKEYAHLFSVISLFNPRTYTQIRTPTVVQGGGGWNPSPGVFNML